MSTKTWLLCLGVCGVSACRGAVSDNTFDIVFDPCQPLAVVAPADASLEERASLSDALAMWNAMSGSALVLVDSDAVTDDFAQVVPISFENASLIFYGVYRDEIGDIVINRQLEDRHERAVTIAHELGHAFSLPHLNRSVRASVMNRQNLQVEPNEDDAAWVWSIWGRCSEGPLGKSL